MTENKHTLLPCPFCGGSASYKLYQTSEWIACDICDAATPSFFVHGRRCDGATQKQSYGTNPAVKLWNKREDASKSEMQTQIALAQSIIPEGYKVAKDTLPEQVALIVAGLRAYSKEREELLEEIRSLERQLSEVSY